MMITVLTRKRKQQRRGGVISISSAVLCEVFGALCGCSERLAHETAGDKTDGLAEERREELKLGATLSVYKFEDQLISS